jgi:hypothetical protein
MHILAFPNGLRQRPAWRHLSAIGSSLPSLFVLPSNVTFAFRSVTPEHAQAWTAQILVYLERDWQGTSLILKESICYFVPFCPFIGG